MHDTAPPKKPRGEGEARASSTEIKALTPFPADADDWRCLPPTDQKRFEVVRGYNGNCWLNVGVEKRGDTKCMQVTIELDDAVRQRLAKILLAGTGEIPYE